MWKMEYIDIKTLEQLLKYMASHLTTVEQDYLNILNKEIEQLN